jgi:hypothetical protein
MNNLIKSLVIFSKYFDGDTSYPTRCEHNTLILCVANDEDVISDEDKKELDSLGWHWSEEFECWCSFDFGSC